MDAYRVFLVTLCLAVLAVSQEVSAKTLPVEGDQVVGLRRTESGVSFNAARFYEPAPHRR
jgi:hypothetical protein